MNLEIIKEKRAIFLDTVIEWGHNHRRDFPWRREADVFHILIAEVLLQRSRSGTVEKIYSRLFDRYPTLETLAEASIPEIEDVIKTLGLTKRAATLKSLAQVACQDGLPESVEGLMLLPGIGRYVASATAAAAFGSKLPLVDSVTSRIYRRYFGLSPFSSDSHKETPDETLWEFVSTIVPEEKVHEFNWVVLDLAASLCTPKKPKCGNCPLHLSCSYNKALGKMHVVELFAGVGGFRLGLEGSHWQVTWSNQWEPTTTIQYASECYISHFGTTGHICADIKEILDDVEAGRREIPEHELLVGGFPCQDYSVARTLSQAEGLQGKKGVLWWEIYRLIRMKRPPLLFLENVDRLLKSPANQRGRDFAVMLACLSDLGYLVEWRVINAADYGFPQKRRRVFIIGRSIVDDIIFDSPMSWLMHDGVLAKAFPVKNVDGQPNLSASGVTPPDFRIEGDIKSVSDYFGKKTVKTPFQDAGVIYKRDVWTRKVVPHYQGKRQVLKDILQEESEIDESFFIPETQLEKWIYLKGAKSEERTHKASGFRYNYTEGGIPFPDDLNGPARTILTAEGGATPSRFKHVVLTPSGRYRRLTPVELERLNGFPDDWTSGIPDTKRAFLMGNALVVGIIEQVGKVLADAVCEEIVTLNKMGVSISSGA